MREGEKRWTTNESFTLNREYLNARVHKREKENARQEYVSVPSGIARNQQKLYQSK